MWPMDHCLHFFTHYCEMPFHVFCPFFFQWGICLPLLICKWFICSKGFVLQHISFHGYGLPFNLVHCVFWHMNVYNFYLVKSTRCLYAVMLGIILRQPFSSPDYSQYRPPWSAWTDDWVCFPVTTIPQPLEAWPWVSYLNLPEPALPYK